jgi:hypothetical protein
MWIFNTNIQLSHDIYFSFIAINHSSFYHTYINICFSTKPHSMKAYSYRQNRKFRNQK